MQLTAPDLGGCCDERDAQSSSDVPPPYPGCIDRLLLSCTFLADNLHDLIISDGLVQIDAAMRIESESGYTILSIQQCIRGTDAQYPTGALMVFCL